MPLAGDLSHRVALDKRIDVDDDAGNTRGEWREQFQRRAAFVYAGGGEAVMAARLEGRSTLKVQLRSCSQTRTIQTDWRLRDARLGTVYDIREVDAVTDPRWIYIVAQSGTPA